MTPSLNTLGYIDMTLFYLKIIHVLGASFFFTGASLVTVRWLGWRNAIDTATLSLDKIIWLFIIPTALIQLITGFSIISIKQYRLDQVWIAGSLIGFFIQITGWMLWQNVYQRYLHSPKTSTTLKKILSVLCIVLMLVLLMMIFFMTNKHLF